ncbi:hypothetical protein C8A00DRAFT_42931 [Chaetomidium leptoderma]|uniref:2EXR domain-containing protein n=1 Tax=Chaetomidium leptoderma TaxID=669021 RepID=A0AAN6VN83_9PEZI|nr:hypothetical protein C8A00DRAFT_42931 [Chaetomidium leptoderma]
MTTFHPFPRLPFELRARVWELTVVPRTVRVRIRKVTTFVPGRVLSEHDRKRLRFSRLVSSTPVPATLQACREARSLGLYQQAFSELAPFERRYVWLNLDIDMISIETCRFRAFKPVAHLIKRLKFERAIGNNNFFYYEAEELHSFPNAKEIHVVCADADGIES